MPKSQIYIIYISNIFSEYQNVSRIDNLLNQLTRAYPSGGALSEKLQPLVDQCDKLRSLNQALMKTPLSAENWYPVDKFSANFEQFSKELKQFDTMRNSLSKELGRMEPKSDADKKAIQHLKEFYVEPLFGTTGVCSGLATWWAYSMSENNERQYYAMMDEISGCLGKDNMLNQEQIDKHELALMKYNAHIRWLHTPSDTIEGAEQKELELTTGVFRREYSFNPQDEIKLDVLNEKKFADLLRILPEGRAIHIGEAGHAIAIYKRGDNYFYFDSNHPNGIAEQTTDVDAIAKALNKSFSPFEWFGGYLKINIFVNPGNEKPVADTDRIKWIEFMKSCNNNRKDSLLQTAARAVGTINLETLRAVTGTSDPETLTALITKENVLNLAYDSQNYNFIKAMVAVEKQSGNKVTLGNKLELLKKIFDDYISPSPIFATIRLDAAEDLIRHILNNTDEVSANKFLIFLLEQAGNAKPKEDAQEAKLMLTLLSSHDTAIKSRLSTIAAAPPAAAAKLFNESSSTAVTAKEILANIAAAESKKMAQLK